MVHRLQAGCLRTYKKITEFPRCDNVCYYDIGRVPVPRQPLGRLHLTGFRRSRPVVMVGCGPDDSSAVGAARLTGIYAGGRSLRQYRKVPGNESTPSQPAPTTTRRASSARGLPTVGRKTPLHYSRASARK